MAIRGARTLTQGNDQSIESFRMRADINEIIYIHNSKRDRISRFTDKVLTSDVSLKNKKFSWQTDSIPEAIDTLTGAMTASGADTTVEVADTSRYTVGCQLFFSGNAELALVESIDSATSMTVTRAVGTVAVQAHSAGAVVLNLGVIGEEGGTDFAPVSTDPTEIWNYAQIHKDYVEVTLSNMAIGKNKGFYGSSDYQHALLKTTARYKRDKSLQTYVGQRGKRGKRRFTGGILAPQTADFGIPTANIIGGSTVFTYDSFAEDLRDSARRSADDFVLFTSALGAGQIDKMAESKYELSNMATEYGVAVRKLHIAGKDIHVVVDELLGDNGMDNIALALSPKTADGDRHVKKRTVRKLFVKKDMGAPGDDVHKDQLLEESGVEWGDFRCHLLWTGVAASA